MRQLLMCIATSTLLLAACASKPVAPVMPAPMVPPPEAVSDGSEIRIDIPGLVKDLGLDREANQLGYAEHAFNTCEAGFGYSHSHNCHVAYVMSLHLRLQCREQNEVTNSALVAADLHAIATQDMKWAIRKQSGLVATDGEGYAQVAAVFDHSPKRERIRLQVGSQFLYMRAGDVTRIVTPPQWCDSFR